MTFKRKVQVQRPFSMATATGGKKKQKKILQMSEQVTVISSVADQGLSRPAKPESCRRTYNLRAINYAI